MKEAAGTLWAAVSLAHPGILACGVALTAIPLLIHWFSRRRVRTVEWAAFEFLLGAQQRDQRRVRIEDWLLVALRCLLVLVFALLIARPILRAASRSSSGAGPTGEHVLILDDSRSMHASVGNETAWDRALRELLAYCQERAQDSALDTCTVWVTSRPRDPLFTDIPLTADRVTELARRLESLPPNDSATPLGSALSQIGEQLRLRPERPEQHAVIWSDLRRRDWPDAPIDEHPEATLAAWTRTGWQCRLVDCGEGPTANLRITDCQWEPLVWDDVPTRCLVTIHNAGATAAQQIQVQCTIDGSSPVNHVIESLAAGATESIEFPVMFRNSGASAGVELDERAASSSAPRWRDVPIELRLTSSNPAADNRLANDDVWNSTIAVYTPLPVLIVEGNSPNRDQRGSGFFLQRALAPDGGVSGFVPQVIAERDLADASYESAALVVLADVVRLQDAAVERLKAWVERGGNLVILSGPHTDRAWHNDRLGSRGARLAPFELLEMQGDESHGTWQTVEIIDVPESPLGALSGSDNPLMNRVQIYRWWTTRLVEPRDATATNATHAVNLLATLRNAEKSPAIGAMPCGLGRVIELGWSADLAASNWPTEPSFVVFFQQLASWLAASRWECPATLVGAPFRKSVDLASFEPHAALRSPDQRYWPVTATAATELSESGVTRWQLIAPPPELAGAYVWELTTTEGRLVRETHNVNADTQEGELQRADVSAWRRRLGSSQVELIAADDDAPQERQRGDQELLGWVGWLALGLLVGEPWWAWQLGKRR